MNQNLIAKAKIIIKAPRDQVWDALVNPVAIKHYMFDTNVISGWYKGSKIVWKGEWEGKEYEDRGVILRMDTGHFIEYSHFSPLSGMPDEPQNYHNVSIELSDTESGTLVSLEQDNNANEEEQAHSESNWNMMLAALKRYLEG
jgi:uncharacterized protein YndB with AHSA1/START domain